MPPTNCDWPLKHVTLSDPLLSRLSNFLPPDLTSLFKMGERHGLLHSEIGLNQGWCVKNLSAEMKLMKFKVLPLRVLASREVVRERLDYKEHLVGATRDELDNLEKLPGRFKEIGAKTVVKTLDEEGEELEEVGRGPLATWLSWLSSLSATPRKIDVDKV